MNEGLLLGTSTAGFSREPPYGGTVSYKSHIFWGHIPHIGLTEALPLAPPI